MIPFESELETQLVHNFQIFSLKMQVKDSSYCLNRQKTLKIFCVY